MNVRTIVDWFSLHQSMYRILNLEVTKKGMGGTQSQIIEKMINSFLLLLLLLLLLPVL